MTHKVLVLYYSKSGFTRQLANFIARGINQVAGVEAVMRTVPMVSAVNEQVAPSIPEAGSMYVSADDLNNCAGLALGSPINFGNMNASLKYFLDSTVPSWLTGSLVGKPACVFASGGSLHGGQESCLLSMMIPLLHHGMLIMGLPYTNNELNTTSSGGTPYGVTHYCGVNNQNITEEEKKLAIAQGERLANLVVKLNIKG